MTPPAFTPGSLVRARGREWIVLPDSQPDLLMVRPLGGADDEVTGILAALEEVTAATFAPPDPAQAGDFRSCRLLRDAVRLGIRAATGPFRSFGHLGVEPRPYQLVPLLMALRLDPVRLLIADDVGIGKTIEACLIARELLDRGDARRLAVLCPPQLAEQWQAELSAKFHIDAELVLAGTAARLERGLAATETLFDRYPYVIVSLDFIKSERRRGQFLLGCPDLVIVDEAHSCAEGGAGRSRQQRHELLRDLAKDSERHIVLVTATPHSGNENAFRSLLGLLDTDLVDLPDDLSGRANETQRRRLARHLVQRRRDHLREYLTTDTAFPERREKEVSYELTDPYRKLFERALEFAKDTTEAARDDKRAYRIRWWSMLALLRALGSSPAAAAATLRARARAAGAETAEQADELGREAVLDLADDQGAEAQDATAGSDFEEAPGNDAPQRRTLLDLARQADALAGDGDRKLALATEIIEQLVADEFQPIVFCRFIPTAEYVGAALRQHFERRRRDVAVEVITGLLAPEEREGRIAALGTKSRRVLVATDCLSEGINLQDHFSAVFHYDLSWNPTRHEQREGRVDRFGQPRPEVRVVTFYGSNNPIDGMVLDVLLRKHKAIRKKLGVSVPVPIDTDEVVAAILEGLVLRGRGGGRQLSLFEEELGRARGALHDEWERTADREEKSRSLFAQETIQPAEVARELTLAQAAVGAGADLARFLGAAFAAQGATVSSPGNGAFRIDVRETPRALRDLLGIEQPSLRLRTTPPAQEDEILVTRTHPLVEALASYVVDTALDPLGDATVARRCGTIRTRAIARRTTLLLVRFRFDIESGRGADGASRLAEECGVLAFEGGAGQPEWLSPERAEALLDAQPDANVDPGAAADAVRAILAEIDRLTPALDESARNRADELAAAHERVRAASRGGARVAVTPHLPIDVVGLYVFLPVVAPGPRN